MLRIFSASSQTGTMLAALYANKTRNKDTVDVLIIDRVVKKKSLIEQVHSTIAIHPWHAIIDLSSHLEDNHDFKISSFKRLKRKIRSYPFISHIYTLLLNALKSKNEQETKKILVEKIQNAVPTIDIKTCEAEIYTLPGLYINEPLFSLFKNKKVSFFEHGTGDYVDIIKSKKHVDFYCVFANAYQKYIIANNLKHIIAHQYVNAAEFDEAAKKIYKPFPKNQAEIDKLDEKSCVLILLDASEMYYPPENYWTDYLKSCISKVENPEKYTFLIKPHGLMSEHSQHVSYEYIKQSGLKYIIFDSHSSFFNIGAEIIFSHSKNKIAYVFSTFSFTIFLLAQFYPKEAIYIYHYTFCSKYFTNAPQFYLDVFNGLKPLVENVFTNKEAYIYDSQSPLVTPNQLK